MTLATPIADSVALPAVDGGNGTLTDEFLNGLVQGGSWTFGGGPQVLTYSFSLNDTQVYAWTAEQQNAFAQAFASWSNVANLTFVQSGSGGVFMQSPADLALVPTGNELQQAGGIAFGIFPDPDVVALIFPDQGPQSPYSRANYPQPEGDIFFDSYYTGFSYLNPGGYGLEVMVHEIGHALGLKHPEDDGINGRPTFAQLGITDYDSGRWTVMSNNETSFSLSSGQIATPMPLDILAIQQIYGANMTYRAGDDVYTLVPNFANPYSTIWDAGGTDTFDASGYTQGVRIDLRPGVGYAQGASANDGFTAIAFNVTIENATGGAWNDTLVGNDAANVLTGGAGHDALDGGAGADILYGNQNGDTASGGAGNDTLYGGQDDDSLFGNQGDDSIQGNFGNDVIHGGAGNDSLHAGQGDDTLIGGVGFDTLDGGIGRDVADFSAWTASLAVDLAAGIATSADPYTQHLLNFEIVVSGAGHDTLTGGPGNDTLDGNAGQDSLTGGFGDDSLAGGLGVDMLFGNQNADHLSGGGDNDSLYGGQDNDVVEGGDGDDYVEGNFGGDSVLGERGNDTLHGGQGNDTMDGGAGDDSVAGGIGDDSLFGGGDTLLGFGSDTLAGGQGNDRYEVAVTGTTIVEAAGEGDDSVSSDATFVLPANVEHLALTGGFSINGTGNDLDNTLTGNFADNVLDGGAGNDTLAGGAGFDTYVVDSAGDHIIEDALGGTDLVQSSVSYALGATLENLTLTGSADIDATGNETGNALTGNAGNNVIAGEGGADFMHGEGGDDTLVGGEGSDLLDGGAGVDSMQGGTEGDLYVVDDPGDIVIESADEGLDTVDSELTYVLPDNVENLLLTGGANIDGTGNGLDNSLSGNAGNNVLTGAGGNDTLGGGAGTNTLIGGAGNDFYFVSSASDIVVEDTGAGTDWVAANGVSWTLPDNVENLNLIAYGDNLTGTGNALDNVLNGDYHTNVLIGGAGNDTLNPGGGLDTLIGGPGDDVYGVAGFATDNRVVENADEGADLVLSFGTDYVLPVHVENLEIKTFGAGNGTGNDLDNRITGNTYDNVLDGGAGNDTLTGGAGDDTYIVDAPGDVVAESPEEGADQVRASIDYTLGADLENLMLTGTAAAGTGNGLANVLVGNAAGNLLDGLVGADTLMGGAGDDVYVVDDPGDSVSEAAPHSIARVSTNSEGVEANHGGVNAALSADGNYVVFQSAATNLAGPDVNGYSADIYVKDLQSGTVTRISTDSGGTQANDASTDAAVSADGLHVAFSSLATNLVAGDTNGFSDVFVKDLQTGALVRASTSEAGIEGDGVSFSPSISGDGRYVAFESYASNLVAGDGAFSSDIFVKDLATGVIVRASTNADGSPLTPYFNSDPAISTSGSHVAFESYTGLMNAIFVKNLETGALVIASSRPDGTPVGFYGSWNPAISADGRYVAFETRDAIVVDDTNIQSDIYVKDLATGAIVRASTAASGEQANAVSSNAAISADGRYVAFESSASNLVEGDTNGAKDIFVKDLLTGSIVRVSADSGGAQSNNFSYSPALSADGGLVVFHSTASNLVTGDSNGFEDVFVAATLPQDAGGIDEVQSGVSFTLPAGVENLVLTGSDSVAGTGNDEANWITGNGEANTLSGLGDNDTLDGDGGDDALYGNLDNDSLQGGLGNDSLFGGQQNDRAAGGDDADYLEGNLGDDTLMGDAGVDTLHGGQGNDVLEGGAGNDSLVGGLGVDTLSFGSDTAGVMVDLAAGTASGAETGTDTLAGFEAVSGGAGGDTLSGGLGNDTLSGGVGNDSLSGAAGDDAVFGNQNDDAVEGGAGNDSLYGGQGNDVVSGGDDNDYIEGNLADDMLAGGAGNDTIHGGQGNDTMEGGAGNDSLTGGLGMDTLSYGSDTAGVTVDLVAGTATGAQAGSDTLAGFEAVIGGAGSDTLNGGLGADTLAGGAGNDTLRGGDGSGTDSLDGGDALEGGDGADSLVGGYGNDTLSGGAGIDTLYGNQNDDSLAGGDDADWLYGGQGNDVVAGGAGDDNIQGNFGSDFLDGGDGNDTLHGGQDNDTLIGGAGNDSLVGGLGDDTLSWSAGVDTLAGGTGNDVFLVTSGAVMVNAFDGGDGSDTVRFTSATPGETLTFVFSSVTGIEAIEISDAAGDNGGTVNLSVDASNVSFQDLVITGNDGDNSLEGGSGNDIIFGGAGNDTLNGGFGANVLEGGAGDDVLRMRTLGAAGDLDGGAGNDTLLVHLVSTGAVVDLGLVEDQFTDAIDTQVQTGFEHVDAGEAAYGITLIGDGGDNRLIGSSGTDTISFGADSIDGGGGDDTLAGGGGNDTLSGGVGNDTLDGGAGNDVFRYDATGPNTGDVAANGVDSIAAGAGDLISLPGLIDELEIGNTALSALTADTVVGSALSAGATNIAFVGGALQIDLDGNGIFEAANDFQIALSGVTTVTYNFTDDLFHLA